MSAHASAGDHHADHGHDAHGGGHGHHNAEYPFLAHHFETPAQQFDSAKLGMWVFLVTEVLFFGALFVAYAVLRNRYPEVFKYASAYLDTTMGGINTGVLILSSLTMAMGVYFAQTGRKAALVLCLWLTMAGAAGFMVIKYFEYTHKFHLNLKWGQAFYQPVNDEEAKLAKTEPAPVENPTLAIASPNPSAGAAPAATLVSLPPVDKTAIAAPKAGPGGVRSIEDAAAVDAPAHAAHGGDHDQLPHLLDPELPPGTHRFFAIYYIMTGLHGIHVVIGVGVIGWILVGALRGRFSSDYYTPVDLVGLYWHVVDLVWIFLFPLFYLIH